MATITTAPSANQPISGPGGLVTRPWYVWFTQLVAQTMTNVVTSISTTGSLTSTGGSTPVLSLQPSGVTPGTYGDATHVAQVTMNGEGIVTAAVNVPISGGGGTGANWSVLTNGIVATPELIFAGGDVIMLTW